MVTRCSSRGWRRPTTQSRSTTLRPTQPRVDRLEARVLPSSGLHFDFGTTRSPDMAGYTRVTNATLLTTTSLGYGWANGKIGARDRNAGSALTEDYNYTTDGTFAAAVPAGTYAVTVYMGDMAAAHDLMGVFLEGAQVDTVMTAAGQIYTHTYTVNVQDGQLTLRLKDLGGTDQFAVINGLDVVPVSAPTATFGNSGPTNEGGSASVSFTNVSGGSGGYTYSYDFNNDGSFDVVRSTQNSIAVPAQFLDDGPSTQTVRGRITDSSGATTDYTTSITIANVAPTSNSGGPYTGTPGTPVSFAGSATDPSSADTAAGFTYQWYFGDGTTATGQTVSHAFATAGTFTAKLTVTDKDGGQGTATAQVVVSGAPITGTLTYLAPVAEGSSTPVTFTNVSGGNGSYTYSYDFNNDGLFEIAGSSQASAVVPASYLDDGPATRVVHGRITDSAGNFADFTTSITISNVAPTPHAGGPYSGAPGQTMNFAATATDPSSADTAAGFTYQWSFGDGATGTGQTVSHVYTSAGTFTTTLTVTDKDGGQGTAATTANIAAAGPPQQFIVTPYDRIPNFGANPTIASTRSGNWSDPGTWSLGRLPTDGDIVNVTAGTTVTYDANSTTHLNTVSVLAGGTLTFRTDVTTELVVGNLLVLEGGELDVGTVANPVAANVTATIVIANQAINTAIDPEQYGTGLIGLGKVSMDGATKSSTFVNLAAEPHAGDTTLHLAAPVSGWRVGDELLLPDTRQQQDATSELEIPTLAGISPNGTILTLSSPLLYDHLGARDGNGTLRFLPDVGDFDSNVMVESEIDVGTGVTHGYVMFTGRADVDIRYTSFEDMGRTLLSQVDNTTFDTNNNVTHLGTNEGERVAVILRHLVGPQTIPADGYQFTLIGNSIGCDEAMNERWGIDVNDSHYGLVQGNFVHLMAGAGIVTESGNESYNVFDHNFVASLTPGGGRADTRGNADFGFEGSGFWFRGPNNYVRNNVVADGGGYGYTYYHEYVGIVRVPAYQGADPSIDGQYQSINVYATPLLQFTGNTVYGTPSGMTFWWLGTSYDTPSDPMAESLIQDFHVWNFQTYGIYGYQSDHVTVAGFVALGDQSVLANQWLGGNGIWFSDYFTKDFLVRNADIENQRIGVFAPYYADGTLTIQDSYLRNATNVEITTLGASGSSPDGHTMTPRQIILQNDLFAAVNGSIGGVPHYDIDMEYGLQSGSANLIQSDTVMVYSYNQAAGDNFQVYYLQQDPNFVVPQSIGNLVGSPVAGLTNQQNWQQYGIAIAGAVSPTTQTRSNVSGYVRAF